MRSRLREYVRHDWSPPRGQIHYTIPLELGPRPTWRGGVDWLSPNYQGLEQWELCQREGKSNWMDVQALAHPAASAPQAEKEVHCVPRSGMHLHTQVVFLEEPRIS